VDGTIRVASELLEWLTELSVLGGASRWAFFKLIFTYIDGEIASFQSGLISAMIRWVGGVAMVLMTIWIFIQGYRIVTGQSRESMMALLVSSLRAVLIVTAAGTFAFAGTNIRLFLSDGLPKEIHQVVTGEKNKLPQDEIDKNLQIMEASMIAIEVAHQAANTDDSQTLKEEKDRAMLFTGAGVAGPSVVGGALLLMYRFALALFVGFGPLFILCLLFEQTRTMFQKWLWYGVGTMFSLAVLSFTSTVVMKMLATIAAAMLIQYKLAEAGGSAEGISSLAMQQGGVGLLMTALLILIPPMAAAFFQGTLAQFSAYTQFGVARSQPEAQGRV
jgi:type IV secretion system protein VirB6